MLRQYLHIVNSRWPCPHLGNFVALGLHVSCLAMVLVHSVFRIHALDKNLCVMLLVGVFHTWRFRSPSFMNNQDSVIELRIQSNLEYTDLVENVTNNLTALAGCDSDQAYFIEMAVREIVVNAIRHGNQLDLDKVVRVNYRFNSERFEVGILDQGPGFDFDHLPDPCDPENLMKSSGRGIFLVRSFMDDFSLARLPDQGTEVRFAKKLSHS